MKNFKSFVCGAVSTVLVASLTISALAASGKINISVNPNVSIKVNGEMFQPKDVNGKSVQLFEYEGTTYAPLRAMAEEFGLEVGYDAAAQMAVVGEGANANQDTPAETSVDVETTRQQFLNSFTMIDKGLSDITLMYSGDMSNADLLALLKNIDSNALINMINDISYDTAKNDSKIKTVRYYLKNYEGYIALTNVYSDKSKVNTILLF